MGFRNFSKSLIFFIIGHALLVLQACKKSVTETGEPIEIFVPGLDPVKLTQLLLLKASDTLYKPVGIYDVRFEDTLKKFYIAREGNPVWLNFLDDSMLRVHLLEILSGMEAHGLQTKFYNHELITRQLEKFDKLKKIESDADYHFLTDLDYLLSMSVISVYKDLTLGRIDPYKFYKPFYSIPLTRGRSFNIFCVLQNPLKFYDSMVVKTPCSRRYHTLQNMFQQYSEYVKKNNILDYDTSLEMNSPHNTKVLDQRLEIMWKSVRGKAGMTAGNRDEYINETRALLGMPPGGIDSVFLDRVCVTSDHILDNLLVSLERERWFSVPDTGIFVLVRLNEFMVYMQNDSLKSMKVCVGKSKPLNYAEKYKEYLKTRNYRAKPIDSETPQIGSEITEVIINPTWTVPNSIIGKEMYSQIVNDPSYLTRKGYEVLRDGKVVSPGSVSWRDFKPYGVTVKIRQKAGPSNSLGRLKFNFPNHHNIYLHDTPEKGKFGLSYRAVSHGCIRLNDPPKMAEFLLALQGDTGLVDKFRLKMGLQPYDTALQMEDSLLKPIKNTETIRLKKKVPIFLDYRTILIERNGSVRFVKDIYRKNEAIAKKLKG